MQRFILKLHVASCSSLSLCQTCNLWKCACIRDLPPPAWPDWLWWCLLWCWCGGGFAFFFASRNFRCDVCRNNGWQKSQAAQQPGPDSFGDRSNEIFEWSMCSAKIEIASSSQKVETRSERDLSRKNIVLVASVLCSDSSEVEVGYRQIRSAGKFGEVTPPWASSSAVQRCDSKNATMCNMLVVWSLVPCLTVC